MSFGNRKQVISPIRCIWNQLACRTDCYLSMIENTDAMSFKRIVISFRLNHCILHTKLVISEDNLLTWSCRRWPLTSITDFYHWTPHQHRWFGHHPGGIPHHSGRRIPQLCCNKSPGHKYKGWSDTHPPLGQKREREKNINVTAVLELMMGLQNIIKSCREAQHTINVPLVNRSTLKYHKFTTHLIKVALSNWM